MDPISHRHEGLRIAAAVALGIAFVAVVATTLVTRGPFAWHVGQPEAWQGLIEAFVLFAATLAGLQATRLATTVRVALIALPVLLYLRRHHVDAVVLLCLAYVEGVIALGASAARVCRDESEHAGRWLRWFLSGLALLALGLWLAQAAGWGTPRAQRTVAIALLLPALLWHRRLQSVQLLRAAWRLPSFGMRAWAAWLIVFPLVLFARTNTVMDFDSFWYGLRPERVLVGESSVFEPLGFASPVHYFPKLYEVLLLPLSASREDSVVVGFAVFCSALLARLVFDLLRRLQASPLLALAGTAAIWAIPAVASVALGAKPDVLAALLVVAMVWFTLDLLDGRRRHFAWVVGCAALAVSAKIVAIPYAGVAGLVAVIVMLRGMRASHEGQGALGAVFLGASMVVAAMCLARTIIVAGMPTLGPEQLVQLWQALGMHRTPPVGLLEWAKPQTWSDLPSIVLGWIAEPSRFSHLQISWPSNLYVYLPLAALVWPAVRRVPASPRWVLWMVPLTGLALLVLIGFTNKGGDGNYFIPAAVLACVAGLGLLAVRAETRGREVALAAVLACFTAFHFSYAFVSVAWGVGTRVWDRDFSRPNRESPQRKLDYLSSQGLDGVVRVLQGAGGRMRVSGMAPIDAGFRLPARYEDFFDVHISHIIDGDNRQLLALSACGGVEAMLIPVANEGTYVPAEIESAVAELRAFPADRDLYADARWRLIDVRGALPPCETRSSNLASTQSP